MSQSGKGADLRSRYEAAVAGLRAKVTAMRRQGRSSELIALAVHAERRQLTAAFKELTPEPLRSRINSRTLSVYGDPVGPTVESLRTRGKSWDDIIGSATRPGPWPLFYMASKPNLPGDTLNLAQTAGASLGSVSHDGMNADDSENVLSKASRHPPRLAPAPS